MDRGPVTRVSRLSVCPDGHQDDEGYKRQRGSQMVLVGAMEQESKDKAGTLQRDDNGSLQAGPPAAGKRICTWVPWSGTELISIWAPC
jgi:hypothetical protein